MTSNQKTLRELMAKHSVISSYIKLAEFWGLSIHTVHAYLKPVTSKSNKNIPDKRIKQLKELLSAANAK